MRAVKSLQEAWRKTLNATNLTLNEVKALKDIDKIPYKKLAKIEETTLGFEDHGIFTVTLQLSYGGGSMQAAGMHMLSYSPKENNYKPLGSSKGIDYLIRIMRVCGVSEWSRIKGRTIYALFEDDNRGSYVRGIASLPTEGSEIFWFDSLPLWPESKRTEK